MKQKGTTFPEISFIFALLFTAASNKKQMAQKIDSQSNNFSSKE